MAGCVPCFVIPLLLFIFHRYIQPILLRFWNPWASLEEKDKSKNEDCKFSCECAWNKKELGNEITDKGLEENKETTPTIKDKVKEL